MLRLSSVLFACFAGAFLLAGSAMSQDKAENAVSPEQIKNVVQQHSDDTRKCYSDELAQNPALAGKIVINFVVGKDGKVISTKILESTMNNEKVEQCVSAQVASWQFPSFEGDNQISVDYPFVFEAR